MSPTEQSSSAASPAKHRVCYLGPAGTFTHAAAETYFESTARLSPCLSIDDVFRAVAKGEADFGVVPVENSTEGAVNNTQDCLLDSEPSIVGEIELPIRHQLMGKSGSKPQRIAAHRQALAQCRQWLSNNYPNAELLECASNAQAAELAASSAETAAIGSNKAAEIYGLDLLAENIQDNANNRTRFLILADRSVQAEATGFDKTSLIIYTNNEPGALFRLLEPFERHQLSLTKIETRPSKMTAWEYVFFVDFQGHRNDERVAQLFADLSTCTAEVKVLGSYPRYRADGATPVAASKRAIESSAGESIQESGSVLIFGLGMIGGSIARGLRAAATGRLLWAIDSDMEAIQRGLADGTLDAGSAASDQEQSARLIAAADLIVLCVPPLAMPSLLASLADKVKDSCVVTDVGSVKSHLLDALGELPEDFRRRVVPGHPIAGSEQSGFAAASSELFRNRRVILTPIEGSSCDAVGEVNGIWRALGADILGMEIHHHDAVLAATSHLPHALAYAIVDVLLQRDESDDIFRFAAGGFADFSRLASSNPTMWAEIFTANADATVSMLENYIANLDGLKNLISERDTEQLKALFTRAKSTRDNFLIQHFDKTDDSPAQQESDLAFTAQPGGSLSGSSRVPGDKSISHRSVILGSIADGVTEVSGFLEGEDALNTVAAFREMGVTIVGPDRGRMQIYGVGMRGLKAPRRSLYMGNSGTAMRLLAGLLAAQNFDSELSGDESLQRRPMKRVADPLAAMGAQIATGDNGTPPLRITGSSLNGMRYEMPMASAQVKSALLLAGLYAEGETCVIEPEICRDHTERMLTGFGAEISRSGSEIRMQPASCLKAQSIDVPGDISSAAFFLVGASIAPGSDLLLEHVGVNPTRTGIITLLQMMGADIELLNEREVGGEPVADLRVRSAALKGIDIPAEQIPLAIDEFPVLFIAAACAEGETVLRGAEELRVKESDRIAAMAAGLETLGVSHEVYPDGIRISGGSFGGGEIDSAGDHRIAMAFSVAALRAEGPVRIRNCQNVATSFPGFVQLASSLGLQLSASENV